MKPPLLFRDSHKSFSPLLSQPMVKSVFYGVIIQTITLLFFWPTVNTGDYYTQKLIPQSFFLVSSITLLILAFIGFRSGSGYMGFYDQESGIDFDRRTLEESELFFIYALPRFLIHSLLMIFPFLPTLFFSASLSGISLQDFTRILCIAVIIPLQWKLFAFLVYLFLGKKTLFGFVANALWFMFLFGFSFFIYPSLNPILVIHNLTQPVLELTRQLNIDWSLFISGHFLVLFCLISANLVVNKLKPTRKAL